MKSVKYAAAAAVVAGLFVIPLTLNGGTQVKTMNLLNESIAKVNDFKTVVIKYLVRTLPNDNFDYIDAKQDFVEHSIVEKFGDVKMFRIEKSGRVAVFDGKKSYLWLKPTNQLFETEGYAGIFGTMNDLLVSPENLLENAQKSAKSKGAKVDLHEIDNTILLIIEMKAQGDFSKNDYLKNSSIFESDNKQFYTFDKTTKLLYSLVIQQFIGGKYVTVLESQKIEYDVPVDENDLMYFPENLTVKSLEVETEYSNPQNLTPKQAVEALLNGFKNRDISQVGYMLQFYPVDKMKKQFFGLEVLQIGEPFKSGVYVGYFVPIKVKLANGEIKQTNLAVRNDNKHKVWLLDGGI